MLSINGLSVLRKKKKKKSGYSTLSCVAFGDSDPSWKVAPIVHDVSSLLRNVDVLFSHVRCSANKVADFVARYVNRHGWLGGGLSRATIFDKVFGLCLEDIAY